MGLVQKGVLFSGTIASNIKLAGEDEISDETMKEAAQTAQATEFIDAKPEGYDSPVAQEAVTCLVDRSSVLRLPGHCKASEGISV